MLSEAWPGFLVLTCDEKVKTCILCIWLFSSELKRLDRILSRKYVEFATLLRKKRESEPIYKQQYHIGRRHRQYGLRHTYSLYLHIYQIQYFSDSAKSNSALCESLNHKQRYGLEVARKSNSDPIFFMMFYIRNKCQRAFCSPVFWEIVICFLLGHWAPPVNECQCQYSWSCPILCLGSYVLHRNFPRNKEQE